MEMTEQKIEQFWRDATAGDIAKVMKGEKVEARFRDDTCDKWKDGEFLGGLRAFRSIPLAWIDLDGVQWAQCQVYEPQQWWLDKPDPGEGWRLLEKFPDEPKFGTDEAWNWDDAKWQPIAREGEQEYATWYRRRIEPNKPEKLESSTCASNIPKGWTALSLDEPRLASDAYWSQDAEAWIIVDGWVEAANREKWPAIRQVENWRCMMLMEGCFYRLPNGQGIEITKEGFELG